MPFQRERNAIASHSRTAAVGSIRFAIKLAWDGTAYQGFQAQTHGKTIQNQVENRLIKLLRGRSLRIFGWGRTDAGVHARGAVVTVDLTVDEVTRLATARKDAGEEPEWKILAAKSIRSALREFSCEGGAGSITAISVVPVCADFDPRFSSLWKRYIYFISCGSAMRSPFMGRYAWQVDRELDVGRMVEAAELLSGRHNFEWLSVTQEGELRDPVRVLQLTVERVDPGPFTFSNTSTMIKISGTCDFFLYRMMRRIVGVLASIGGGRADIEQLKACLDMSGDQESVDDVGTMKIPLELKDTAPAHGLCLDHIEYEVAI
jgi:tRNA pseudouridine38-40 synthase